MYSPSKVAIVVRSLAIAINYTALFNNCNFFCVLGNINSIKSAYFVANSFNVFFLRC
jgi:hypothetical protein